MDELRDRRKVLILSADSSARSLMRDAGSRRKGGEENKPNQITILSIAFHIRPGEGSKRSDNRRYRTSRMVLEEGKHSDLFG